MSEEYVNRYISFYSNKVYRYINNMINSQRYLDIPNIRSAAAHFMFTLYTLDIHDMDKI